MNLEQFVEWRLSDIKAEALSGVSEMTGKVRREYYDSPHDYGRIVGRYGGLNIEELQRAGVSPGRAARAIEAGKGKVYDRIVEEVVRSGERQGLAPARKRSPGKPTIPPHAGRVYCAHCRTMHTKGQHRFHGAGSFHRTHLFAFKNPMTVTEASRVFADLMGLARRRSLTVEERAKLARASQVIRYQKRKKFRGNAGGRSAITVRVVSSSGAVTLLKAKSLIEARKIARAAKRQGYKAEIAPASNAGGASNVPDVFKRFLKESGYMESALRPDVVEELWQSIHKPRSGRAKEIRDAYEAWLRPSLRTPGPLFENRGRRKMRRTASRRPRSNGGDKTRMGKLVEIRYLRDHGRAPGFYKHEFKSRPTVYYTDAPVTVPAGAIVIYPKGK